MDSYPAGMRKTELRKVNRQQNGHHERIHPTLKKEATKPVSINFLRQQGGFDDHVELYINDRPHEALGMPNPAGLYTPPVREYGVPDEPRGTRPSDHLVRSHMG